MVKRIEVSAGGASATFRLLEKWASRTTSVVWDLLPVSDCVIRHGKSSGDAVFLVVQDDRVDQLPDANESPVRSIYPGYMVARLPAVNHELELLISYGTSEYSWPISDSKWPSGRDFVTPIGRIEGLDGGLLGALEQTWNAGPISGSIRRTD
jgi:hypothetical protein